MFATRDAPAVPAADRAALVALLAVQVIFATLHVVGKLVLTEIPALAAAPARTPALNRPGAAEAAR